MASLPASNRIRREWSVTFRASFIVSRKNSGVPSWQLLACPVEAPRWAYTLRHGCRPAWERIHRRVYRCNSPFFARPAVIERRNVGINGDIGFKTRRKFGGVFLQQRRRCIQHRISYRKPCLVHPLPQGRFGGNVLESQTLLKIIVLPNCSTASKSGLDRERSPIMVSNASAVLILPSFFLSTTAEIRSRRPQRWASIPIIASPPWLVRNSSVSVMINFVGLGNGTFRVSGSYCILVNCFSLLFTENWPFCHNLFTDLGISFICNFRRRRRSFDWC